MLPGWCCIANRHIGARERRQLIPPHVRFQVPFLGPESQLKSGFACAGLLCSPSQWVSKMGRLFFTDELWGMQSKHLLTSKAVVSSSGASCALGRLEGMSKESKVGSTLKHRRKGSGGSCFSVGPGCCRTLPVRALCRPDGRQTYVTGWGPGGQLVTRIVLFLQMCWVQVSIVLCLCPCT